jgi:hypothetical protein
VLFVIYYFLSSEMRKLKNLKAAMRMGIWISRRLVIWKKISLRKTMTMRKNETKRSVNYYII